MYGNTLFCIYLERTMKISRISALHYTKLIYRSALFFLALYGYLFHILNAGVDLFGIPFPIIIVIWGVYVVEMILRFFPSRFESMGCQKQFPKNYLATGKEFDAAEKKHQDKTILIVALLWIALDLILGIFFWIGWISKEVLFLTSLAFGACDMICILFFCPFHTWIMKNKCCVSCRIYNWDYVMMFTPLIFIRHFFTWSLLLLAIGLLVKWEFTARRHPERFLEKNNKNLSCANCEEKLCHHKKSLQRFLKKQKRLIMDERLKK